MAYNKGLHSSNGVSQRGRPFVMMLLIIFGAALLGVMVLHKLRERRIFNLIVKDKDRHLLALQLLIQKERDRTKELRGKNEEMKRKIDTLTSEKMELDRKVLEMQSTMISLKDEQKVMESAFNETLYELRIMQQKGIGLGDSETIALRENLNQKEAEIKDSVSIITNATNFSATWNENRETDEHSGDSPKFEVNRHNINEDASKSNSTMFKDSGVKIEVEDEIQNEEPQDDSDAVISTKDLKAEIVDGREMKVIKEEQTRELKGNADGGRPEFYVKQSEENSRTATGVKRKHGHVSRKKEKQWRTIVKNSLMEKNGISENHKEVHKDGKDELKDKPMGKVSNEENVIRKDKESDNFNKKQEEEQFKYREEKREDAMNMIVNNTIHQVTNNGSTIQAEKERLDEIRGSEEQEVSVVQQNWSRRHMKRAEKNVGETKSNMFDEHPKETNVSDVEKQKKDDTDTDDGEDNEDKDDEFPRESQSEFEEDKEEYKEELDESEFHSGL